MNLKKFLSTAVSGMMLISMFSGTAVCAAKNRVSVHDPSVFKDPATGTYYVFGSHIDAAKTNDLQNWTLFTNGYKTPDNAEFGNLSENLKKAFEWCGEDLEDCIGGYAIWAPDVIYNPDYINADGSKGAYMMYFCASSTYIRSVICFATSKNAEGPYTFGDTLIYSGFTENDSFATSQTKNVNRKYTSTNIDELIADGQVTFNTAWFNNSNFNNQLFPNAIDPTIYYDTNGKMYMCYGSWSGGIFTLEIDPATGRCIHPKTGQTADGRMVDSYFGTKISGGYGKSGEGPFIEYNPDTGYYYLWVTYGGLVATGGYNMRVFRSESPLGPFTDAAGRNAVLESSTALDTIGLKVMGNYKFSTLDTAYMAPGHNSVLRDDDGKWYLFNHTRFNGGTEYHEVRVHSMQFNAEGWPVVAPNEYSGDEIDQLGYNSSDIAGTYEFINHGNDTGSKIYESSLITLTPDGKITGSATGTWYQDTDSADAVISIDGQRYSGKFLAAKDEKGTKVMSFTAVGNNNQTVWGNQTSPFTGSPRTEISAVPLNTDMIYTLKNKYSDFVMDIENGVMENSSNIQQWELNGFDCQKWTLRASEKYEGYYSIHSYSDEKFALRSDGKENGGNIDIAEFDENNTSMLFRFILNPDNTYSIATFSSGSTKIIEVESASKEYGANIQQWEINGSDCQKWVLSSEKKPVSYTTGDLNDDGLINIADLVLLKNVLLESSSDEKIILASDINEDGVVTTADFISMINKFIGKE